MTKIDAEMERRLAAFGERVKQLRNGRRWRQADLAAQAGLSVGAVAKVEQGYTVELPTLQRIARALGVELALVPALSPIELEAAPVAPLVAADLLAHGFAAALEREPSEDDWRGKLLQYGADYMSLGAAVMQQRLAGDLVVLQRQVEEPGLWDVAAKLMTLFAKTFPGTDGSKAMRWYQMAAMAADRSGRLDTRVWVRGRAAIALGYEGASLAAGQRFAESALGLYERPSLGQLNALMGRAHMAALQGDRGTALAMLERGRRVFDLVGSSEQQSDYAIPEWRMEVFCSLLLARLGDGSRAIAAQDAARRTLPSSLPRFATHLEMHTGLMLARAGDRAGGRAYAQAALDRLPPEKHSLTLRMLMLEIERG